MCRLGSLPWPQEWEPYHFSRAQLLSLALSLECLGENKAWILLHLTNTSCPAQLSSVQSLSPTLQCPTLCDPMDCSMPGFPVYHQLPGLAQTHVRRVGDAIQPTHPLLSPPPPTFNLSQQRVFSSELVLCIRWPKHWNFSFSISPSSEYSGLISLGLTCLIFGQGAKSSCLFPPLQNGLWRWNEYSCIKTTWVIMKPF